MARRRIAVLVASIDREYQQDFASGLVSAGVQNDVDICIFNSIRAKNRIHEVS